MKKFLKWTFGIIGILVALAVVAVVIFIKTFDLNKYKPMIQKIVLEQTGRTLALNGDIGLKLSFVPTVYVNDVTLSNASWAKEPSMAEIKQAEVVFSVLPLLQKKIDIDSVYIDGADINLIKNKDGLANWVFSAPEKTDKTSETKKEAVLPAEVAAAPLFASIIANKVDIVSSNLKYQDLKASQNIDLKIENISLKAPDFDENITLDFAVVYNGEKITGTAETDSINSLMNLNKDYSVKLNAKAFGAALNTNAVVKDVAQNMRFEGTAHFQNPAGNFGAPEVTLDTDFSGTADEIEATLKPVVVAGNVINGQVKANLKASKPVISATLKSDYFDLRTLQNKVKTAGLSFLPQAYAANFVPDTALNLAVLNTFDANVGLDVKSLAVNDDLNLSNIQATANVKGGVLNVTPLKFGLGGGTVDGNISLSAGNNLKVNIAGKNISPTEVFGVLSQKDSNSFAVLNGGLTDFDLSVNSNGATLRSMVENADGQFVLAANEAKLQAGELGALKGNIISDVLSVLNIKTKQKNISMKCAVVRADIKNGKATFPKGIVFDSSSVTVVVDGTVNLKNDKLDFTINPFNGDIENSGITQAVTSLVKLGGTVNNPQIKLDSTSVLKNVVGYATTGPLYLGSQMMFDVDSTPCYTALQGTKYQTMFKGSTGVKATTQGIYQGVSGVVDDGVNMIKGTAKGLFRALTGQSKK